MSDLFVTIASGGHVLHNKGYIIYLKNSNSSEY